MSYAGIAFGLGVAFGYIIKLFTIKTKLIQAEFDTAEMRTEFESIQMRINLGLVRSGAKNAWLTDRISPSIGGGLVSVVQTSESPMEGLNIWVFRSENVPSRLPITHKEIGEVLGYMCPMDMDSNLSNSVLVGWQAIVARKGSRALIIGIHGERVYLDDETLPLIRAKAALYENALATEFPGIQILFDLVG